MSSNADNSEIEEPLLSVKLIEALMKNDVDELKRLREAGESFSLCDEEGNNLLHLVVMDQKTRTFYSNKRRRPKFQTGHLTRTEAFYYLLTVDDIPKDLDNFGMNTVLMDVFMSLQDSPDWAIALINCGCEIHEKFCDGDTALHWAIYNEWIDVIELLIENGVDVDGSNAIRKTPLHQACVLGLVDVIWMLLFYGANPNLEYSNCSGITCFDIAATYVRPEVQEIFFNLIQYEKRFNLVTFVNAMENDPEIFYKIYLIVDKVTIDPEYDLLSHFSKFNPDLFKLFVQKFDYLIKEMFTSCWLEGLFDVGKDKNQLQNFTKNIFILFESHLVNDIVAVLNKYNMFATPDVSLVSIFREHKDEVDTLTQLLCFMLSYGLKLTAFAMEGIYFYFGYSDLFKMMLHMDIRGLDDDSHNLVPQIFYDLRLTPKILISCCKNRRFYRQYVNSLAPLFDYFALRKLVDCCMDSHLEYMEQIEYMDDMWVDEFKDSKESSEQLAKRIETLPVVPKLVELARNKARLYIIWKYKTKNSRQFQTIINWLPISKMHKRILTYETKLYD